jgi:hypothetical protein
VGRQIEDEFGALITGLGVKIESFIEIDGGVGQTELPVGQLVEFYEFFFAGTGRHGCITSWKE